MRETSGLATPEPSRSQQAPGQGQWPGCHPIPPSERNQTLEVLRGLRSWGPCW
jgi:hypothetical protein